MVTGFGSCQLSQRGNTMMSRSEVEQPRVGAPSAPVAPVRSGASGAVNIGNYIIISSSGACGAENPPCTTSPNVAVGGRRSGPRRSCEVLRQTAIRTKNQTNTPAADPSQVCCSRDAESFGDRTCLTCRQIERSQDAGTAAAVPVVCRTAQENGKQTGSRSDVVMSALVDSGRESGHDNIDANDPKPTSHPLLQSLPASGFARRQSPSGACLDSWGERRHRNAQANCRSHGRKWECVRHRAIERHSNAALDCAGPETERRGRAVGHLGLWCWDTPA
jgi:hypothetical protein